MTVFELICRLTIDLISFRIRPGDLVVREYGEWLKNGSSNYKVIYFYDRRILPAVANPHEELDREFGGLSHQMFNDEGTERPRRLVALD